MRRMIGVAMAMAVLGLGPTVQARQASAQAGAFQIVQVSTNDPDKFLAEWAKPSEPARLETQSSAKRGETLHTFIMFGGCKADKAGQCQVTADFTILKPDGAVYAEQKDVGVYRGRPAPPANSFYMSDASLGLRFEAQDPLGAYTVKVVTTDQVAGVSLSTQQVLTATD